MTRREFGRVALMSASAAVLGVSRSSVASAEQPGAGRRNNRSIVGGVQFGLQPFCYHDLAMTPENRSTLVRRLVQNGMGLVELHATWVEPRFTGPGISAEAAREKLRAWRLGNPVDHYRMVKREFDEAGIDIFTYYVNINETYTDAEIDAVFAGAKLLGARGCVGSQGLDVTRRVARFPGRHGMFLGVHNHDNLSDPDAINNEASFVKALGFSPDVRATLDTRHFTAANGDCIDFLEKRSEEHTSELQSLRHLVC